MVMAHPWPSESTGHPWRWRPPVEVAYYIGAPKATGATAGTPGTWTPAGSGGINGLADLSPVVASPATAWTTGQYMRLNDGTEAHWNGSIWVVGRA